MSAKSFARRCLQVIQRRLVLLACLFGTAAAHSQIAIVNTGGLSFGSFAAGSGGTVAVPTGGGRIKTGGVMLVTQGGISTAAQFTVSGTANATYAITLPANGTVTLSSGSNTMAVNNFVSSRNASDALSAGGSQLLSVGATLTVGNAQAPGSYTGSFPVTVSYN